MSVILVQQIIDASVFKSRSFAGLLLRSIRDSVTMDCSVAAAMKSASKSDFVKAFLGKHPDGNVKAVNDAWKAAGMTGSIGDSLSLPTIPIRLAAQRPSLLSRLEADLTYEVFHLSS